MKLPSKFIVLVISTALLFFSLDFVFAQSPQRCPVGELCCTTMEVGGGQCCYDYAGSPPLPSGVDNCTDSASFPSDFSCSNPGPGVQAGGQYRVCCSDPNDLCSQYRVRSPMCGSASESFPGCTYSTSGLACCGNNYRRCDTNSNFPPPAEGSRKQEGWLDGNGGITQDEDSAGNFCSITYNGTTYNEVPNCHVWVSDSINCGIPQDAGGAVGGEGESRLWFPHLRLLAALSTMAQSISNPHPSALYKNTNTEAPKTKQEQSQNNSPLEWLVELVTTKIIKHQGKDDSPNLWPVVNTEEKAPEGNNSTMIVGQEVPKAEEIYQFVEDPYTDLACVLPEVKNNPGDSLLGPKITARVLYTQKKSYKACQLAGCAPEKAEVSDEKECCAYPDRPGSEAHCKNPAKKIQRFDPLTQTTITTYECGGASPVLMDTEGKVSPFVKNPLIEYIYDVLVNGEDSLFKRFMPYFAGTGVKEFEELPSSATYTASAISINQDNATIPITIGDGQSSTPTFYIPHVGSLKKYWLEDFQEAIRPKGVTIASGQGTGSDSQTPAPEQGNCVAPEPESTEFQSGILDAGIARGTAAKNVPRGVLEAIYSIEALPYYTDPESYNCSFTSYGFLGLMQIGGDYAYQAAVPENQRPEQEEHICKEIPGKLNKCYELDAMEIAARILLVKVGQWPGGKITTRGQVHRAACGYYGSDKPDGLTRNYANGHFEDSQCRDGDCDNMSYADIVCLASGFCDGANWSPRLGENCSLVTQ